MRNITEYDGYKLNPKRKREDFTEEEAKKYEEEKQEAKRKSEEILKKLGVR